MFECSIFSWLVSKGMEFYFILVYLLGFYVIFLGYGVVFSVVFVGVLVVVGVNYS